MQVLRLLNASPFNIKYSLGEEIGFGADGQVFNLSEYPDRVIKLSVLYDNAETYEHINNVLLMLEKHNPNVCACVYEHAHIGSGEENIYCGTRKYTLYYYVMEKLCKITEDEKRVFHSIMSHEDRGVEKNLEPKDVLNMLKGMQRGLDFDLKKVFTFYNNVRNCPIKHNDIHVRNIMKDSNGNFKLIDFDRVEII